MAYIYINGGALSNGNTIVLIIALSFLGSIFLALLAITAYRCFRRRQCKVSSDSQAPSGSVELQDHPHKRLSFLSFTTTTEIGDERATIIKKSLARRPVYQLSKPVTELSAGQSYDDLEKLERQTDKSLRTDWKEWEARVQEERGLSVGHHPALGQSGRAHHISARVETRQIA